MLYLLNYTCYFIHLLLCLLQLDLHLHQNLHQNMAKLLFNFLFLLCSFANFSVSFAQNTKTQTVEQENFLSLEQYLQQVQNKNLNIISYNQQQVSNENLAKKSELITAIKLYGFSQRSFAEQNKALQLFRYSKLYNQNNQIGLNYQSSYQYLQVCISQLLQIDEELAVFVVP